MTTKTYSPEEQATVLPAQKLRQFYLHVLKYVLVIGALTLFNVLKHPEKMWVIWPALGWGLGLVFHAVRVFNLLPSRTKRQQVNLNTRG